MNKHRKWFSFVAMVLGVVLLATPVLAEVTAAELPAASLPLAADNAAADQTLFAELNAARVAAGLPEMAYDAGLEKVAMAYAEELCLATPAFRKETDYRTLPSGESVYSLVGKTNYPGQITNFYYYVWQMYGTVAQLQNTPLYKQVTGSNFNKIGVAAAKAEDGYHVMVVMFAGGTPPAATLPEQNPPLEEAPPIDVDDAEGSVVDGDLEYTPSGTKFYDFTGSLGFKIGVWPDLTVGKSELLENAVAQLMITFENGDIGYLRVCSQEKDIAYEEEESSDAPAVVARWSPIIHYKEKGPMQATWLKNDYTFCFYMKKGEATLSEAEFVNVVENIILFDIITEPTVAP